MERLRDAIGGSGTGGTSRFANYSLQRAFCAEIKGRRPHTFPRVRMLESEIHE